MLTLDEGKMTAIVTFKSGAVMVKFAVDGEDKVLLDMFAPCAIELAIEIFKGAVLAQLKEELEEDKAKQEGEKT